MNQFRINKDLAQIALGDKELRCALEIYGFPAPRIRPQGFETLLSIIVGQQISTVAAKAIMSRISALMSDISAQSLAELPAGSLRDAGLSRPKAAYVRGLAEAINSGQFKPLALEKLSDAAAIDVLTGLKGIGTWSAEVYLMFSLQRRDIFPAADIALLIALQRLKNLSDRPTAAQARELIAHWSPWRSAGSLFLWHYYRGAPA